MISHRISQMGHLVISKIRLKLNRIYEFGILSTFPQYHVTVLAFLLTT